MSGTKRRNLMTSFPVMSFCYELLGLNWSVDSILVESNKGYDIHEMPHWFAFCYGDYHHDVLVYLKGKKCLDF
jgi:hypothetical protein